MTMKNNKVDVGAVIDSAGFFWMPCGIALMMIVIMLADGFDLFIMGYIADPLVADFGITRGDLGPVNSAGLIGMAIGSVLLGWLGDRVGRKRAYVSCLSLLFLGSLICYFSSNLDILITGRLIMGFGLGGITPLATTLVSEWTNKNIRSVVVAAVIVAIPLGGALGGLISGPVLESGGWRGMFLVGSMVPLAMFVLFSFLLPESPKYLAKHPELHKRLAHTLNRLLGENRFDGTEEFVVVEAGKRSSHWFSTLWNTDFRARTTFIWTAFAINSFVLYVFTNYLPTLLTNSGLEAGTSRMGLTVFSGGAALGSVGGALFINWFGSKYVGTILAAVGGLATAALAMLLLVDNVANPSLLAACLVAGASINGMQAFLYAVSAHSYPTEIRASAVGMAQTFSRIGAVASPWAATFYFKMDPAPPVSMFLFAIAGVIVLTVTSFFLIPTHIPSNSRKMVELEEEDALRHGVGVSPPE
ncbi:MAG: MFS transporter [Gammaproteobacteria bacterium]|nr:MAG: MFS transporter [Gammaproteobacteria bacterium]